MAVVISLDVSTQTRVIISNGCLSEMLNLLFLHRAMGLSSLVTAAQSAAAACPTPEDREHLLDTAHKLSIAAVHVLNTVQELKNKDKM